MWQKRKPVFSPRITGCRPMERARGEGTRREENQELQEKEIQLKTTPKCRGKYKTLHSSIFLGEEETQNHSINITSHKTPSVFNYNQLRECVRMEGKQREGDMKEGPCDLEVCKAMRVQKNAPCFP